MVIEKIIDRTETIARACHEINRVYCLAHNDLSQLPWSEAPEWQKKSAKDGVLFLLRNPKAGPSSLHENWKIDKLKDGWVYGEVKDVKAKTHPCIVDYSELSKHQRTKDILFISVVKSFL